jgi:glyceraldehyde 3-phosphate dehydrogenase
MKKRIAINGFGRIGRLAFRQFAAVEALEVVAINDVAPLDNLAYLLRHDSVHVDPELTIEAGDGVLRWGKQEIRRRACFASGRMQSSTWRLGPNE